MRSGKLDIKTKKIVKIMCLQQELIIANESADYERETKSLMVYDNNATIPAIPPSKQTIRIGDIFIPKNVGSWSLGFNRTSASIP